MKVSVTIVADPATLARVLTYVGTLDSAQVNGAKPGERAVVPMPGLMDATPGRAAFGHRVRAALRHLGGAATSIELGKALGMTPHNVQERMCRGLPTSVARRQRTDRQPGEPVYEYYLTAGEAETPGASWPRQAGRVAAAGEEDA